MISISKSIHRFIPLSLSKIMYINQVYIFSSICLSILLYLFTLSLHLSQTLGNQSCIQRNLPLFLPTQIVKIQTVLYTSVHHLFRFYRKKAENKKNNPIISREDK